MVPVRHSHGDETVDEEYGWKTVECSWKIVARRSKDLRPEEPWEVHKRPPRLKVHEQPFTPGQLLEVIRRREAKEPFCKIERELHICHVKKRLMLHGREDFCANHRLTPGQVAEMIRRREAGESTRTIGNAYGMSHQGVINYLSRNGRHDLISLRRRTKNNQFTFDQLAEVIRRREARETFSRIEGELGISRYYIKKHLRRHGREDLCMTSWTKPA
jgi:hypothetical protein